MANEKRLIDANFLKGIIQEEINKSDLQIFKDVMQEVCNMLDKSPTVDAVEVVRCEKCLYRSQYANENGMYKCGGILTEDGDCFLMVKPDHFCAFGKQRGKDGGNEDG